MLLECETLEGLEIIKSETLTDAGIVPIAVCKSLKIICLEQTPNVSFTLLVHYFACFCVFIVCFLVYFVLFCFHCCFMSLIIEDICER